MAIETSSTDVRDAFFGAVLSAAATRPDIVVITVDQGAFLLDRFRHEHPDRYFNVGISEQHAIDLATGLAMGGHLPVVYGIANFVSLRCLEQLAVGPAMMDLPIIVVASGAGLMYSGDGPTHHAVSDVAALRAISGFQVFCPADAVSTAAVARTALASQRPSYVRLEKGVLPVLYQDASAVGNGCALLRAGTDLVLISTGYMTHTAMDVATMLGRNRVDVGVLDVCRVTPLDERSLTAAMSGARRIAVLEELSPSGGLFGAVAESMIAAGTWRPTKRFGLPAGPIFKYGSRHWLHAQHGLDAPAIASALTAWLRRPDARTGMHAPEEAAR